MCQRRQHVRMKEEEEPARGDRWKCDRRATVLVLCLLCKLIKAPGQNNVMGSSVPFLTEELHIDDLAFAQLFSMGTLLAACVQPAFGLLLDKFGIRICIPLGLAALAGGMALLSLTTGPAGVLLSFVIIRATSIGCLEAWPAAAISIWFQQYRGRAMALMMVVGGLPTGVVAALMQTSDMAMGWRQTFQIVMLVLLTFALVCAAALRDQPFSSELPQPLEGEESSMGQSTTRELKEVSKELSEQPIAQLHSPSTDGSPHTAGKYTLGVIYCSAGMASAIAGGIDLFVVEMAAEGSDTGSPSYDVASAIFLPIGMVLSTVCLIAGALLDRGVRPHRLFAVAMLLHGLAALTATQLSTLHGGVLYAISRGVASGVVSPLLGCTIPHFFGTSRLGRLLGGQSLFFVGGTCLGALLIGCGPKAFGSYTPMLLILAVPSLMLALMLLTLQSPRSSSGVASAAA